MMPFSVFTPPDSSRIKQIFTEITPRYDLLNALLSLNLDCSWRQWAVGVTLEGGEKSILDIGTGTGKFLKAFLAKGHFEKITAMDLCESMLEKARRALPDKNIAWLKADISSGIPVEDDSFDLVTAAFTLRSIKEDLPFFFSETARVLSRGGKAAFLELTRPRSLWFRALYFGYLRFYLPLVGALISGSGRAYSFLADSILHFDEPGEIRILLEKSGFEGVKSHSYTGGIVTLITARKA